MPLTGANENIKNAPDALTFGHSERKHFAIELDGAYFLIIWNRSSSNSQFCGKSHPSFQ